MATGAASSRPAGARRCSRLLITPPPGCALLGRMRARILVEGSEKGAEEEAKKISKRVASGSSVPIGALGTGSDYTPFLQHLGIASLDLGFGGENKSNGIYNSIYDSFDHYLRFGGPDF